MEKKKIVFFTNRMTRGGSERVISYLANGLCKEFDVDIVTMTCEKSDYELDENVSHIVLEEKIAKNNHSIFLNIKRLIKLKKYIKNNSNGIFISFVTLPSYILLLLFRKLISGKIIVAVRNDPKFSHKHLYDKFFVKALYPKADAFVFQTEEAQKFYDNIHINKKIILPNPINSKFIKKPYEGEREKIFVNVGRLIEQKNQKMLIEAFKDFYDNNNKEYKLYIYGEGYLRDELTKLIKELKMEDNIILKGSVKNLEKEIYNKTCFILSSNFEGMPNALLEAMSLGLPVISTKCSGGGPQSIINNKENGILIDCDNKIDLVNAMNFIALNYEFSQKMGQKAYETCVKMESEDIINLWKSYILQVI